MYYNKTMKYLLTKAFGHESIDCLGVIRMTDCRVIHEGLYQRTFTDWEPQSVILFLMPYYTGEHPGRNISLYAIPRDYHHYVKGLFERILPQLSSRYPINHFVGFADHSPIGEVAAAAKAGLGILGDLGQLIHPRYGAYTFIGEIFTDYCFDSYDTVPIQSCTHCGACRRACPVAEGCLSEITQRKGELSVTEIEWLRRVPTAWGCDLCRTSCPMNHAPAETPIAYFREALEMNLTAASVEEKSAGPEEVDPSEEKSESSATETDGTKKRRFGWIVPAG